MARPAVAKLPIYVVQARFTDETNVHTRYRTREGVVYLDEQGNWSSLSEAARHRSRTAAETALEAAWHRLRARGSRNVILSIQAIRDEDTELTYQHAGRSQGSGDSHV